MGFLDLDEALSLAGNRVDRVRQSLYYCDVEFSRKSRHLMRQDVHSSAYVLVAAAVEKFVNDVVEATITEINSRGLGCRDAIYSLFSITMGNEFLSLQDVRGLKMWEKRVEVLAAAESAAPLRLSSANIPLDGRTIRPAHLNTIWRVFGLSGGSLPDPRTGLALTTIADLRNLVAHGEEETATVAGMHSIDDTLRLLDRIDGLVVHFHAATEDYLSSRAYLR
ncbi:HEPN domain-containing protein [Gordonia sp. LSe1-13]|uniref:HEPN domain-containing protein n=1 Tax=Gordonia sesuvii TaxID=3116777 RepID=A0ABU7M783_9ACTN|nr:HEPN domain-containing protein [Gordonia sp. LSe1-13]